MHMHVAQHVSQCLHVHLPLAGGLPAPCEDLSNILLFTARTTCYLSLGMTMQPATHRLSKALLHRFPCLLVTLQHRMTKQRYAVLIGRDGIGYHPAFPHSRSYNTGSRPGSSRFRCMPSAINSIPTLAAMHRGTLKCCRRRPLSMRRCSISRSTSR